MKNINITSNNNILRITLNREEEANSLDRDMLDDLIFILSEVKNSQNYDVIIIDAKGVNFSSGIDFNCPANSNVKYLSDKSLQDCNKIKNLMHLLDSVPQPLIAYTQGKVYGLSIGILSCCDFVFSKKCSKFCFNEVLLGLIPSIISIYVNRKIGHGKTLELMLSGDVFNVDKAISCGLVYGEVEDYNEVFAFASKLCRHDQFTIKKIKNLLKTIYNESISQEIMDYATEQVFVSRTQPKTIALINNFLKTKKF